jgi:uncharacterized membrane protein
MPLLPGGWSCDTFIYCRSTQVLVEAIRQFASFEPMHLIEFCRLIVEFVRAPAALTPEQAHWRRSSMKQTYTFGSDGTVSMNLKRIPL